MSVFTPSLVMDVTETRHTLGELGMNSLMATLIGQAMHATWTTSDPADGKVSGYYAQAVSTNAPHPAAARLWEEFLYSQATDAGQNGWLRGNARPIELVAMQAAKTADATALANVPPVADATPFNPTQDQITAAKAVVTQKWAAAVA